MNSSALATYRVKTINYSKVCSSSRSCRYANYLVATKLLPRQRSKLVAQVRENSIGSTGIHAFVVVSAVIVAAVALPMIRHDFLHMDERFLRKLKKEIRMLFNGKSSHCESVTDASEL